MQLKTAICGYYKAMFKPVDEKLIIKSSRMSKPDNPEHELHVLQYQLTVKRR
jgi:hypothetical protein